MGLVGGEYHELSIKMIDIYIKQNIFQFRLDKTLVSIRHKWRKILLNILIWALCQYQSTAA